MAPIYSRSLGRSTFDWKCEVKPSTHEQKSAWFIFAVVKEISVSEQPPDAWSYFGKYNINGLFVIIERWGAENNPAATHYASYREDPQEEAIQHHCHVLPITFDLKEIGNRLDYFWRGNKANSVDKLGKHFIQNINHYFRIVSSLGMIPWFRKAKVTSRKRSRYV